MTVCYVSRRFFGRITAKKISISHPHVATSEESSSSQSRRKPAGKIPCTKPFLGEMKQTQIFTWYCRICSRVFTGACTGNLYPFKSYTKIRMKKAKIPRESQQKAKKHKKSCARATIATVPRPPLPRPPPAARLPCVANPTLRALLGHPQSYYSSLPEYSIFASFSLRREKVGQSCPTVGQDLLRARTQQDEALTPSRCLSLSAGLATSTLVLGMCTYILFEQRCFSDSHQLSSRRSRFP